MNSHRINARKSWLILLGLLVALTRPLVAFAAPTAEAERYQAQGLKHYNLGRFDEAIAEFQKAYDLDPDPTLLFNLAQAHRQNGNLDKAIFFLKRYLQMAPRAKDRHEVELRIREMEKAIDAREERRQAPPPVAAAPVEPPPSRTPASQPVETTLNQEPVFSAPPVPPLPAPPPPAPPPPAVVEKPPVVNLRLAAQIGVTLPWLSGARDLGHPVLLAAMVSAAYVATLDGETTLDLGILGGYSPFSYHTVRANLDTYADLISVMVGASLHLPVGSGVAVEPALGLGVTWWRGLGPDNPFTKGGEGATGPIPMPSARLSLAVLWKISPVAFVGFAPTFDFSLTNGAALTEEISSVTRLGANAVVTVGF